MSKDTYKAAQEYTKQGWIIHPLSSPNDQRYPKSAGKRVLVPKWQSRGTPLTNEELSKYFLNTANNIGLQCGKMSGILVIDFDNTLFVDTILKGLDDILVRSQHNKSRGHVYFKYTDKIKAQKHKLLGIEILSDGSNCVLPPSIHKSGETYEWRGNWRELPDMPGEVIDRLNELFNTEKELNSLLRKVRKCFRTVLDRKSIPHGADGREFVLALCADLKAIGAEEKHLLLLLKLLYKNDFDEEHSLKELDYVDPDRTWTCEKLQERCSAYVDCEECRRFKKNNNNHVKTKIKKNKQQFSEEVRKKALDILENGDPLEYIKEAASKVHVGDEKIIQILYCAAISPELNPMHTMTVGRSGSGKSDCCDVVMEMLPNEYAFVVDDLSDKALFYLTREGYDFNKCVIYVDDVKQDNIDTLKTITSNARHKPRHVSVKDQKAIDLEINGSFSVWISTVSPLQDEGGQITRRFLFLNPDESPEQDARVIEFIKNQRRMGISKRNLPEEFEVIKCMTQIIKRDNNKILCPLNYKFPISNQRYNVEIFHNFIECITKIYGKQRINYCDHYLTEPKDLIKAEELWSEFEELQNLKVDKISEMIFNILPDHFDENDAYTSKRISEITKIPPGSTRRKLKVLRDADLIQSIKLETEKGKPWAYYAFSRSSRSHLIKWIDQDKTDIVAFIESSRSSRSYIYKNNNKVSHTHTTTREICQKYLKKIDHELKNNNKQGSYPDQSNDQDDQEGDASRSRVKGQSDQANIPSTPSEVLQCIKYTPPPSRVDQLLFLKQCDRIIQEEYDSCKEIKSLKEFIQSMYEKHFKNKNMTLDYCEQRVKEVLKYPPQSKDESLTSTTRERPKVDVLLPFKSTGRNLLSKSAYIIELLEIGFTKEKAKKMLKEGLEEGKMEEQNDGYLYYYMPP